LGTRSAAFSAGWQAMTTSMMPNGIAAEPTMQVRYALVAIPALGD